MITNEQIHIVLKEVEEELLTSKKIKFDFDCKWSSKFPNKAGVYAIFNINDLVYIGETANLKERMKEVKRTYNHSFRRKLGKHLFKDAKTVKGKFSLEIETYLNDYFLSNIFFSYKELNFGRLEVESYLIHNNKGLLNSKGKRNKVKT